MEVTGHHAFATQWVSDFVENCSEVDVSLIR